MILLAIFAGGGLGSVCRYLLGTLVQGRNASGFPVGTLVVNVLGCVAIGVLARVLLDTEENLMLRSALIVGFCGGFTTFSAFSLELLGLVNTGQWARAGTYVAASVVLCLAGTALGYAIGPTLSR